MFYTSEYELLFESITIHVYSLYSTGKHNVRNVLDLSKKDRVSVYIIL